MTASRDIHLHDRRLCASRTRKRKAEAAAAAALKVTALTKP